MESVYCAICENKVPLDEDHVKVDLEIVKTADQNSRDDYAAHVGCWREVTGGVDGPGVI